MSEPTPMMQQYYEIKDRYPDSIIFFRMGDFYEMFEEDAETVSDELDITLTTRDKDEDDPIPMAGVPYHSVESYLQRLINNGYTVAIAEQTQDPSETTGIVDREVVRVVTPGTVIDEGMIEGARNNFLMCIHGKEKYGIAAVDVSTGDFFVTEVDDKSDMLSEILRYEPTECILPKSKYEDEEFVSELEKEHEMMIHTHKSEAFYTAKDKILEHFGTESLSPLGLEDKGDVVKAAGAALDYLKETQKRAMDNIRRLRCYSPDEYMTLDATTLKNLEIFRSLRDRSKEGTLLSVLDETVTAMGSRKLRNWLQQPLLDVDRIERRLDAVEILNESIFFRDDLRDELDGLYDIERLISRVVYGNADARDLLAIKDTLSKIEPVEEMLRDNEAEEEDEGKGKENKLVKIRQWIDPLTDVKEEIDSSIVEDPPATVKEGGIIKDGFDEELDELKKKAKEGKKWINSLEERERKRTGIDKLKVGYNKVHGYYLEVPKSRTDKVPENYSRKQTLKNAERYYTQELKEKEEEIISSEEKMEAYEYELFKEVREKVGNEADRFQQTAEAVAELDVLSTFAHVAIRHNYNRPEVFPGGKIDIKEGRHPVVENTIQKNFVPNDAYLDDMHNRFLIITGPNMSGKSTYMRQVALITLMAQVGCFVPAEEAKVGVVDRIFTRVGALDDLTKGRSTFMVEMVELANILHNASKNSLILLDEIGSGTSTFDGLSIAWAVTEYISTEIMAKTLFATHYHEITELERSVDSVKNLHVAAKDTGDGITFLHKVREGSTDESYGVHVASLAGLPEPVVERSSEVLKQIEEDHTIEMKEQDGPDFKQMVFDVEEEKDSDSDTSTSMDSHPVIERLKKMDVENMTPMDAMNDLWKLKKELED